jgi:hypothetical protein
VPTSAPAGFDAGQLTNVAGNGTGVLGQVPAQMQAIFLKGFHEAFSIALGNSMWLGVGALVIAVLSVVLLREAPLRHHAGETEAGQAGQPEGPAPIAAFD